MDRGEPRGRCGQQVEPHHVAHVRVVLGRGLRRRARVERAVDQILGPELGVGVGEAHAHAGRVEARAAVRDAGLVEEIAHPLEQRGVDLDRGPGARHLHRGRLAEEVRQRVEERERDRQCDQRVAPGGIAVHVMLLMVPLGSRTCTAPFCTLISVLGAISSEI